MSEERTFARGLFAETRDQFAVEQDRFLHEIFNLHRKIPLPHNMTDVPEFDPDGAEVVISRLRSLHASISEKRQQIDGLVAQWGFDPDA